MTVCARAPEVDQYDEDEDGKEYELLVEVGESRALPHAIPFRVRSTSTREMGCVEGGGGRSSGTRGSSV